MLWDEYRPEFIVTLVLTVVSGWGGDSYNHYAEMGIRGWWYRWYCCTFDCRSSNAAIQVKLTASHDRDSKESADWTTSDEGEQTDLIQISTL